MAGGVGVPDERPSAPLKRPKFAYPFRRQSDDPGKPPKEITDQHEFRRLLLQEEGGPYVVTRQGLWHGGIHVSSAGAGSSLDLRHGIRCMADGHIVAWRLNRQYLTSELPAQGDQPAFIARHSSGFTLVRHVMEFPRENRLVFFSLYMHLQDFAGYEADNTVRRPSYWFTSFRVAQGASDKPATSATGATAPVDHTGLRVRATKGAGRIIGILPRGAIFSVARRDGNWGQIEALHAMALVPPRVGDHVAPEAAVAGWIYLGAERGAAVVEPVMPESELDRLMIPARPIPLKAGDLIGHLGRFDSIGDRRQECLVHLEMFCDESIGPFIEKSRAWLTENAGNRGAWERLGLSGAPDLLRIDRHTTLYKSPNQEGQDAPKTDVVQSYSLSELGRRAEKPIVEAEEGSDGKKMRWWKVEGADRLRRDISGWVREENFAGGRVTREFSQGWVDFELLQGRHDVAHTIFSSPQAYVEYSTDADVPNAGGLERLSPLMQCVRRQLYGTGNERQAANELCVVSRNDWTAMQASRLVVKHESEWANPDKWQQLISEITKHTGPQEANEHEHRLVRKLAWWEDVKAKYPDLPGPQVFHLHPIAMIGNFRAGCSCAGQTLSEEALQQIAVGTSRAKIQEYMAALNSAFIRYKFDSCISRAHFLAQILHESGGLKFTLEGNGRGNLAYDPWRGRGLIQITHEANYDAYEKYCGEDVTTSVSAMAKLETAPHSLLSAAWFYAVKASLMASSDADDFLWVTRVINGGFNGHDDRLAYLNRAISTLDLGGCLKLNRDGIYHFEESRAYGEKRASFAWGLWNDPGLGKHGIAAKSDAEAIKGYRRYLELDDKAGNPVGKDGRPKDRGWYQIGRDTIVRTFATARLEKLV